MYYSNGNYVKVYGQKIDMLFIFFLRIDGSEIMREIVLDDSY